MSSNGVMRHLPALLAIALLPLAAQPPQQEGGAPPQGGPPQQEAPRNLKILKPEEVRTKMRTFTAALGVRCDFCHVQDRASDENPHKEIARKMIAMTQQVNAAFPNSTRERVTCYTCHRGEQEPKTGPPAQPGQPGQGFGPGGQPPAQMGQPPAPPVQ